MRLAPSYAALGLLALSLAPSGRVSAEDVTYRKPPQVVADILTAARVPRGAPSVSPDGARLVLPELPSLLPIGVLAEPVDKLAGLEILPAYHCTRNQLKFALTGFSIAPVAKARRCGRSSPTARGSERSRGPTRAIGWRASRSAKAAARCGSSMPRPARPTRSTACAPTR